MDTTDREHPHQRGCGCVPRYQLPPGVTPWDDPSTLWGRSLIAAGWIDPRQAAVLRADREHTREGRDRARAELRALRDGDELAALRRRVHEVAEQRQAHYARMESQYHRLLNLFNAAQARYSKALAAGGKPTWRGRLHDDDRALLAAVLAGHDDARAEVARLRASLTEAEAVIIRASDALGSDHPVFWILDDYDGSMDSVQSLARERDEARAQVSRLRAELDGGPGAGP